MTAAWVTIALLLVGVPLVAWWVGGRRFWGRMEIRAGADPASVIMRRHGLTTEESATVVTVVTRGQALEDPRQRAAAVELAQLTLDQLFPAWERSSVAQRIVRIVSVVWVLTAVAALVFGVATGRAGDLNWFPIFFALTTVGIPFVQSRRLRRTIVLNSHVRDGAD